MSYRKKLIEVALPLDVINKASAREKSISRGHPSALHLWWARRPLAAARAVIFAQMVDDPSTYLDILRSDNNLRRKAESVLKVRKKIWDEMKRVSDFVVKSDTPASAPGEPTLDEILAELERVRLFRIIEDLVQWENTTDENVLEKARDEIWQSWRRACADNVDHPRAKEIFDRNKLPAFHDPFAGGGSLPLEAQRLGLEAYASDLNPVAVLINKAMIEIPPRFTGSIPVNPESRQNSTLFQRNWKGVQGLVEDVRYYGKWMRDEAEKRIGYLYPKIEITIDMVDNPENPRPDLKPLLGRKLTVIAWIWARTVKSPNPAFAHVDVPLASTFMFSTKAGKEAYVEPIINGDKYRFLVKVGKPKNITAIKNGTKLSRGANFQCLLSGSPISGDYVKEEGMAGRMGSRLLAIVAAGERERIYLPPISKHESLAMKAKPEWRPDVTISGSNQYLGVKPYGMERFDQLLTERQLVALTTLSDLVQETRENVKYDALSAGLQDDGKALTDGGSGASAYADMIGVYLGISVSRQVNRSSTLNFWDTSGEKVQQVFARQALPMTWDFVEGNPFSNSSGNFVGQVDYLIRVLDVSIPTISSGFAQQQDAQKQCITVNKIVSTDPPYYDNVPYADLSDFFYIWLRRSLKPIFPDLFSTLAVPKAEELVAFAYRHSGKSEAEEFFLNGMTQAMYCIARQAHPAFPATIYYAFKQSENKSGTGIASTGWETFLEAVIRAGFAISGTWPIRTELTGNLKKNFSSLASSIVLVCRPRADNAPTTTRREFLNALKVELPVALSHLQRGNIAPVDLAQASIGPGMSVYTRYNRILDAEGKTLTVREALALINQVLDEVLAKQEGDFDADTRWALAWFEQYGFAESEYGIAETLSKAKNTSVQGMVDAGIILSGRGKVRLLKPEELPQDWDPVNDNRLTVWEMVHHILRLLDHSEATAAEMVVKLGSKAETARELAYRLYTICERKKRTQEASTYNSLVQSWPEISRLAQEFKDIIPQQGTLF